MDIREERLTGVGLCTLQEAQRGQIDEPGRQTRSLSGQIAWERLVLPALESRTPGYYGIGPSGRALSARPAATSARLGAARGRTRVRLGAASVGHLRWALWWRRS